MYYKKANTSNFSAVKRSKGSIKYIVVHYTGNNGDTSRNNVDYYARTAGLKASAHYYVDPLEIAISVPWDNVAWHCGTSGVYRHKECRNYNSIGIEMCSLKDSFGNYYFNPDTVKRAARFIAELMIEYNITIDRVIRHYDVTGKNCPRPFLDSGAWGNFKGLIEKEIKGEKDMVYYEKLSDIPAGEQREIVQKLVDSGIVKGNSAGLHLSTDMVRMFVFNNRAGFYKNI